MYSYDRNDRDAAGSAVDLSFSQILEVHSWQQQQQQQRRRKSAGNELPSAAAGAAGTHRARGIVTGRGMMHPGSGGLHVLSELEEEGCEEGDKSPRANTRRQDLGRSSGSYRTRSDTEGEPTDDEEWPAGGMGSGSGSSASGGGGGVGRDVYRFVQPRRLSSWVQDDAVNACFKCHSLFTFVLRKHHCRACGRIFCAACSSQRVVIPGDYESTPVGPSYTSLTSNATDMIGNITWYIRSGPSAPTSTSTATSHDHTANGEYDGVLDGASSQELSAEARQERFLKDVQRLQQNNVISKFTPCRTRAGAPSVAAASSSKSSYVPDGSVLQRVCDDCAMALQQRRQHYNIVKVFELCEFDLKELRALGQVCRKWHRASIMCLSMFRQIQYYLPSHRLSEREKALLVINRHYLGGHTKWILQLIKAIDFHHEREDESSDVKNVALAKEVMEIMKKPRANKCMLTMCSRLCQSELKSVDALEILADESIRNTRLRAMSVDVLLKTATDEEWGSFLPALLHSLSAEPSAADSKLGQALIRQAQCDVRLCYDLYWGLTVMAEDASCRRRLDGIKQRLLLTLAQLKSDGGHRQILDARQALTDDIAEQLLRGQEFVDLMWKVPPRIPVKDVRQHFQNSIERSMLFAQSASPSSDATENDGSSGGGTGGTGGTGASHDHWPLLRLPVDPSVKISGVNFSTIEVKRSAEAPMVITCTGIERDDHDDDRDETKHQWPHHTGQGSPSGHNSHLQRRDSHSRGASAPPLSGGGGVGGGGGAVAAAVAAQQQQQKSRLPFYRIMYKRDDLRKDAIVQNIINVMYGILHQETRLDIPLVTYRVLPTSSFDGLIEIVENAHTLYSIIRDHGSILNFLHHYNGHRTLSEISTSFRESLAAYTVITFLLGVGDRHADNVMLTKDGILFHIDYGFILGKDPKPLQPPMRLDHYMIEALGGTQTAQFEQFKKLCVIAFNCLRRHVSLFMIMLTLVVKAIPEITDFDTNYTQSDLEAFLVERFLPGQTDDEAAMALMLRMEGKLNEKIGLKLSDFVHAHANEKTVSKSIGSVGTSVKVGVEAVSTVASSITSSAASLYSYMWGSGGSGGSGGSTGY